MLDNVIDNEMGNVSDGFPIEIFPKVIQDLIHNANETKCFNKDYFSMAILSTCATAIGNTVDLFNGTYKAKSILWLAIVGNRGTGKTHPLDYAKRPLSKKDDEAYENYEQELKTYDSQDDKSGIKKPKYNHFILDNFTPEIIAQTLKYNKKGVLIFKDELMGWVKSFDQYKSGGDQQMYLELFNGNGLTVDRVTKEPIRVKFSNVNILGGMQPQKIKQLAGNNRIEDGFIDRFLFAVINNLQPILFTGETISDELKTEYHKWINNLLEAPETTINANSENISTYSKWQHQKANEFFNDTVERAIQKKLETYVWRLAMIIEMMSQAVKDNFNNDLQNESLEKAIDLVEYFRENAFIIHDKILSKDPFNDLSKDYQDFYKNLPKEFKRGDVLPLAKQSKISSRSFDRFLKKDIFFKKTANGVYKKKH